MNKKILTIFDLYVIYIVKIVISFVGRVDLNLNKNSKKLIPFKNISKFDDCVFEFNPFIEFQFNSNWEEYLNYLEYVKSINQKIG